MGKAMVVESYWSGKDVASGMKVQKGTLAGRMNWVMPETYEECLKDAGGDVKLVVARYNKQRLIELRASLKTKKSPEQLAAEERARAMQAAIEAAKAKAAAGDEKAQEFLELAKSLGMSV